MQGSNKELLTAAALIVAGMLVFFGFLILFGVDPEVRPLGWAEWTVGGILIAPGFGYLYNWRRKRDLLRIAKRKS